MPDGPRGLLCAARPAGPGEPGDRPCRRSPQHPGPDLSMGPTLHHLSPTTASLCAHCLRNISTCPYARYPKNSGAQLAKALESRRFLPGCPLQSLGGPRDMARCRSVCAGGGQGDINDSSAGRSRAPLQDIPSPCRSAATAAECNVSEPPTGHTTTSEPLSERASVLEAYTTRVATSGNGRAHNSSPAVPSQTQRQRICRPIFFPGPSFVLMRCPSSRCPTTTAGFAAPSAPGATPRGT